MELTFAVVQYSQDHNDKLPPMKNPAVVKRALRHYATISSFSSVASGQPFLPNSMLSGRTLKSLSPDNTVLFYDPKPILGPNSPTDLYRVVGYLDHIIAMPEKRWQRTKKELGVP